MVKCFTLKIKSSTYTLQRSELQTGVVLMGGSLSKGKCNCKLVTVI